MSVIAHAYALSTSSLERAEFFAVQKDWAGMGEHLWQHEIPDHFRWTGYAIGILSAWLHDQGVRLPRDLDPKFSSLWANIPVVLLCTQAANLPALRNSLSALNPSGSELAEYWRKLTGIDDAEAPTFMLDGWRWLNVVVSRVQGNDWLMIRVG
jgi:hypothetical protein